MSASAPDGRRPGNAVVLVAIGVAAGVLSGLLGVGGGVVIVPALVFAAGFGQRRAQATSLAALVPIASVGAFVFGRAASVDLLAAAVLALGGLAGVQIGARVMHRTSDEWLARIFGVFLVIVALTLLR
jgi:uncharacterized membrane protein YfcA